MRPTPLSHDLDPWACLAICGCHSGSLMLASYHPPKQIKPPLFRQGGRHRRDTLKPHRMRYYLQRRDPAFEEGKAEVLEVYAAAEMLRQIPEADRSVAVLSYDEKPGIQAIATTAPDLPPRPGRCATVQRDDEYKRLGTLTLSAAIDLASGFVHHVVTRRHRSREFIAFLERLDAHYPAGMLICLLLDNHSAHCSRETSRFLASKSGRFELVFTPTAQLCGDLLLTAGPIATAAHSRRQQDRTGRSHPPLYRNLQCSSGAPELALRHQSGAPGAGRLIRVANSRTMY